MISNLGKTVSRLKKGSVKMNEYALILKNSTLGIKIFAASVFFVLLFSTFVLVFNDISPPYDKLVTADETMDTYQNSAPSIANFINQPYHHHSTGIFGEIEKFANISTIAAQPIIPTPASEVNSILDRAVNSSGEPQAGAIANQHGEIILLPKK